MNPDFDQNGERVVATIIQKQETAGAEYLLRFPDGTERAIGDAEAEYWAIANALDKPERHECEPNRDLEFQGVIGAPGVGQAWECRECKAAWTRIGHLFLRSDEDDAPQELSPSDVI